MHRLAMLLPACLFACCVNVAWGIDPYVGNDPYWVLLHEPAVVAELKLSPAQRQKYQTLIDDLDLKFFPLRNQSREAGAAGAAKITTQARSGLERILQPAQRKRINEILLQRGGMAALKSDDLADQLRCTDDQKQRIRQIVDSTLSAVAGLQKEAAEGRPREPLEKRYGELQAEQQKKLLEVLKPEQQAALKKLFGAPFDLSKLGQPGFKAPELVDTGEWINATPQQLAQLRGKVVVLHFYAFGCINCIHNFPWYKEWHERFADKDVAVIGIHTPETQAEQESANVRSRAAKEKFAFPIVIDGRRENWNAWGNSMWPAVYVIDQRGYLRDFWPGELKWQGADGEKYIRDRIEQLLAEPPPAK